MTTVGTQLVFQQTQQHLRGDIPECMYNAVFPPLATAARLIVTDRQTVHSAETSVFSNAARICGALVACQGTAVSVLCNWQYVSNTEVVKARSVTLEAADRHVCVSSQPPTKVFHSADHGIGTTSLALCQFGINPQSQISDGTSMLSCDSGTVTLRSSTPDGLCWELWVASHLSCWHRTVCSSRKLSGSRPAQSS